MCAGVAGGESQADAAAVRVTGLRSLVEIAGVAEGVVAEVAAVPGTTTTRTEATDEGPQAATSHGLGRLSDLEHRTEAAGPPPAAGGRASAFAAGINALPGLAPSNGGGPRDPEAAAAATLGEDPVDGGGGGRGRGRGRFVCVWGVGHLNYRTK